MHCYVKANKLFRRINAVHRPLRKKNRKYIDIVIKLIHIVYTLLIFLTSSFINNMIICLDIVIKLIYIYIYIASSILIILAFLYQ